MTASSVFHASRIEDLAELMAFVEHACRDAGANEDTLFACRLAVEEVFVNIAHYGYANQPGPVEVRVHAEPGRIAITIVDEASPFDPADAPAPDLDSSWSERAPGGIGWHLVRKMMDQVRREPGSGRGNVFTLVKFFPHIGTGS